MTEAPYRGSAVGCVATGVKLSHDLMCHVSRRRDAFMPPLGNTAVTEAQPVIDDRGMAEPRHFTCPVVASNRVELIGVYAADVRGLDHQGDPSITVATM